MFTRKILSVVLTGTLIGSTVLPSVSSAKIALWGTGMSSSSYNDTYSSSKKIKSFISWEKKIVAYMTKDFKWVALKLKNANAKKAYAAEFSDITNNMKKVFSSAQYSSDYMFASHMTSLKKEISSYKTLRKELVSLAGSSVNPFSIPTEEVTSVENDMIDLQKAVTASIRKAIDNYDESDFKETGKMSVSTEWSFGKVDVTIEKYTKLLSLLTRSQEVDVTAKAKFSLNMPGSYKYNEETGDYEKTKWTTVTGDLSIDGAVKIINQDVYLSLREYTLTTNLTGTEKESFEKGMKELAQYKGKTVKIPLSSAGVKTTSLNQAEVLAQLKKTLDILETKSLLTPYKKTNNIYTLTIKDETIQSIGAIYNEKIKASDITEAKKEMRKNPLFYTTQDGKKTLYVGINETDAVGTASLTKKENGYSFLLDVKNPKRTGETAYILIEKDLVDAKLVTPEINVNLSYKNKSLLFTGEAYMQTLKIEGALSEENANLNFLFNGKKIGNTTWKKVADTYTYDILFEMTITEMLSKFHISGESTITKGTFPIAVPTDSIEIKKRASSLEDTMLPSDFSDL